MVPSSSSTYKWYTSPSGPSTTSTRLPSSSSSWPKRCYCRQQCGKLPWEILLSLSSSWPRRYWYHFNTRWKAALMRDIFVFITMMLSHDKTYRVHTMNLDKSWPIYDVISQENRSRLPVTVCMWQNEKSHESSAWMLLSPFCPYIKFIWYVEYKLTTRSQNRYIKWNLIHSDQDVPWSAHDDVILFVPNTACLHQ